MTAHEDPKGYVTNERFESVIAGLATKEEMRAGFAELRADFNLQMERWSGEIMQALAHHFELFRLEIKQEMADFRAEIRRDSDKFREKMSREWEEFRLDMRREAEEFRLSMKRDSAEARTENKRDLAEVRLQFLSEHDRLKLEILDVQRDLDNLRRDQDGVEETRREVGHVRREMDLQRDGYSWLKQRDELHEQRMQRLEQALRGTPQA